MLDNQAQPVDTKEFIRWLLFYTVLCRARLSIMTENFPSFLGTTFNVMRPPSKPRPMLASFLAAAVALLPVLLMALSEIFATPSGVVTLGEPDDAGYRGAGLALAAMPFLYVVTVPICYAAGALLLSFRLFRFVRFLAGATAVALLLGLAVGVLLSAPARFGLIDLAGSVAVTTLLFLVTVLPAAICWWFFAVRPHNPSLNTDAPPSGEAPVS